MNSFEVTVFVIAVVVVLTIIAWATGPKRRAARLARELRRLDDFEAADVYASRYSENAIAIDRGRRQIALADAGGVQRLDVGSVVACSVMQDDQPLTLTNRGSQLVGAAVGAALFGGVGAVIGGLSGARRTVRYVRRIALRLVIDDFDRPVRDLVLLDSGVNRRGFEPGDAACAAALEVAERWHGRIAALMKEGA